MEERRKFPRLNEEWKISYWLMEKGLSPESVPKHSTTLDVSGGGLCFVAEEELQPGAIIALDLESAWLRSPMVALARVVWCNPSDQKYLVGAEYFWVEWRKNEAQQSIQDYIASVINKRDT